MALRRIVSRAARGAAFLMALLGSTPVWAEDGFNAPAGFIPPRLHPRDTQLVTKELGAGVYALLSGRPGVDNSGFVVGERGVLVVDAHINGAMARQIQDAVRRVTPKPILYVVNTNYHGDHTFGNYAFPPETRIVAHRRTAERMRAFEEEKRFLLRTVEGDASVFADVKLRLPEIIFDNYLALDLGGQVVQVHHFGPGNTPGDAVVYVPDARVAWTGNLVVGEGTIPPIFEGGTAAYLATIARFAGTIDAKTIVPGHGSLTSGSILGRYVRYLSDLIGAVRDAVASGQTLDETLTAMPVWDRYAPPSDSVPAPVAAFLAGLHRLNIQRTYAELAK